MVKFAFVSGCVFALTGVALGAMGAHALKEPLGPERLAVFETAVRYQIYHALALLILGTVSLLKEHKLLNYSAVLLVAGILLFSGSLYALTLSQVKFFGAITPFGGLCFLLGWLLALIHFIRSPKTT